MYNEKIDNWAFSASLMEKEGDDQTVIVCLANLFNAIQDSSSQLLHLRNYESVGTAYILMTKYQYFMNVEDYSAQIGVRVFNLNDEIKNILKVGNVIIIEGKIDLSVEEKIIIAEKIWSVENYTPNYFLTIPKNFDIKKLKPILEKYKGDRIVFINKDNRIENLKSKYNVSYNIELTKELKKLLGDENVKKFKRQQ